MGTIIRYKPMSSMVNTKLVIIVPPVAKAVMKRKMRNSQNHGAKPEAQPKTSWMSTAITRGRRRPYLEGMNFNFIKYSLKCYPLWTKICSSVYIEPICRSLLKYSSNFVRYKGNSGICYFVIFAFLLPKLEKSAKSENTF